MWLIDLATISAVATRSDVRHAFFLTHSLISIPNWYRRKKWKSNRKRRDNQSNNQDVGNMITSSSSDSHTRDRYGVTEDESVSPGSTTAATSTTTETDNKNKTNIRFAEKRRESTCRFADRVARVSVDRYHSLIPASERPPQTCIATIVAHFDRHCCRRRRRREVRSDNDSKKDSTVTADAVTANVERDNTVHCDENSDRGLLRVLSLGVGTKFLPEFILKAEQDQQQQQHPYGCRVRDLHAEVLARRAFQRYLMTEIMHDLHNNKKDNCSLTSLSVLVRSESTDDDVSSNNKNHCTDDNTGSDDLTTGQIRYKLRPGVTLHLYTSSAPCGNATLKRFCKMSKERFRDDLGDDEWPDPSSHEPFFGHSIKLGEFALLIKKDSNGNNKDDDDDDDASGDLSKKRGRSVIHGEDTGNESTTRIPQQQNRKKKRWPADLSDDWTPPGTTIVGFHHKGSIHTCSDKILRWNVLGLQGSLVSCLLGEPLYLSTLTVGRKLSGTVCRRAVCCRLGNEPTMCVQSTNTTMKDDPETIRQHHYQYIINHLSIMGTAVYLDETGVVETNPEIHGQDVRFHSSSSWAWWDDEGRKTSDTLECINGSSGFLVDTVDSNADDNKNNQAISRRSLISTQELSKLFLEVYNMSTVDNHKQLEQQTQKPHPPFITLSGLHQLKKKVSPHHEKAKDLLFENDRVLSQWRRRGRE
jgi:Adenosine-deaminase (editase) domain